MPGAALRVSRPRWQQDGLPVAPRAPEQPVEEHGEELSDELGVPDHGVEADRVGLVGGVDDADRQRAGRRGEDNVPPRGALRGFEDGGTLDGAEEAVGEIPLGAVHQEQPVAGGAVLQRRGQEHPRGLPGAVGARDQGVGVEVTPGHRDRAEASGPPENQALPGDHRVDRAEGGGWLVRLPDGPVPILPGLGATSPAVVGELLEEAGAEPGLTHWTSSAWNGNAAWSARGRCVS